MSFVVKFSCAVVTRLLFILISLIGVWRVTLVKDDNIYWFLTFLFLPLVVEMIITLKRRKGKDYKWFSPAIMLFLVSIIPSIWILELHHQHHNSSDLQCKKLDSWENVRSMISLNETVGNLTVQTYLKGLDQLLSTVCPNDWILALHQVLLILLIIGKWLLPLGGGVTREELSQLLLIFVGTAADILEFTSETLSDVKENSPQLVYIILAVWTWSMLQFPLHLAVVNSTPGSEGEGQGNSLLTKHSTDIWSIIESLFIQDGPFLVVRLTVMTYFDVFHQMLVFFAIKNFLVVILNFYRLAVICQNYRPVVRSRSSSNIPDCSRVEVERKYGEGRLERDNVPASALEEVNTDCESTIT
ncbi:transmembrane protein 26 [Salmo salar]|uniref:Transmembrane protein 26 n=1 Tax=Salmo salar TaxID=8030 RepID=A0A1S3N5P3_SALSA|nr:transmembrane protein 26 [Salmo salar]|eukprot:XP_014010381.1 PREDICTED: transmembrane protein 26-like [Salmo salar]